MCSEYVPLALSCCFPRYLPRKADVHACKLTELAHPSLLETLHVPYVHAVASRHALARVE